MDAVVLHRVGFLAYPCPKQGQDFKPSAALLYPNMGQVSPSPGWLGCQVLPAIGAISILKLAANSESSRMSHATNLHIATQLLIEVSCL